MPQQKSPYYVKKSSKQKNACSVQFVSCTVSFPLLLSVSMTVAEHILFYSLLKGSPIAEAEEEVENMLQDLGLPHKRDELTQNLSGMS